MTRALGIDWAADMAAELGGDLFDAGFTRRTAGAYSTSDPSGPPAVTETEYECKAIAFRYAHEMIDGDLVRRGDYKVTILLGTIVPADGQVPRAGDTIECPPPNESEPVAGAVIGVIGISQAAVTLHVRGP